MCAVHRGRTQSCLGFACLGPFAGDKARVEVIGSTTPCGSQCDRALLDVFAEALTEHDKGREAVPCWFRAPELAASWRRKESGSMAFLCSDRNQGPAC